MVVIHDKSMQDAQLCDGWYKLQGERCWIAKGTTSEITTLHVAMHSFSTVIDDCFLELNFGNQVGKFHIDGVEGLGGIEVVSGKWTEDDYRMLLLDLVKIASGLPFSAQDAATQAYDRSIREKQDVLYHAFVYLAYVMSEKAPLWEHLDIALQNVLRNPHRRTVRENHETLIWQARDISPSQMVNIATGNGEMFRTSACEAAVRLGGRLPLRVHEQRATSIFDTPENRFVCSFLGFAAGIIDRTKTAFCSNTALDRSVQRECSILESKLNLISRNALWKDVGPMVHFPAASTVMQRRTGYREVLLHYIRLLLATRLPFDEDTGIDKLQMKDIALLYEIWCFFKVVEAVEQRLGRPASTRFTSHSEKEIAVPWRMKVSWLQGATLYYNASFSRTSKRHRSYSTTLRPDITLEIDKHDGSVERHLFDAKFRLKSFGSLVGEGDSETQKEERKGTFRRADLYKMHAYRDAISDVKSVWILYPGTEFDLFTPEGIHFKEKKFVDVDKIDGVGAVSLIPAQESSLDNVIKAILQ